MKITVLRRLLASRARLRYGGYSRDWGREWEVWIEGHFWFSVWEDELIEDRIWLKRFRKKEKR